MVGLFSACNKTGKKKIVILGDSIAEAVIGPSPITERYNYGYYGLLEQCNKNFEVYNGSVSGHESGHLIDMLNGDLPSYTKGNEIFRVPNSRNLVDRVKNADILHISIFGNDLLGEYMNEILEDFIKADEDRFNSLTKINDNEEMSMKLESISKRMDKIMYSSTNADDTSLWKGNVNQNAKELVEVIEKTKKKGAKVFFQKIYNPIVEGTNLVSKSVKETLKSRRNLEFETSEGRKYLKKLTTEMIRILFLPLEKEIKDKKDYYTIDPQEHFNNIAKDDESRLKDLIFPDYVHPSNEGHSHLFILTQEKFKKEGIISEKEYKYSLKKYKKLLVSQYQRLYKRDATVTKKIKKANSLIEASSIYYKAIKGKVPKLPRNF